MISAVTQSGPVFAPVPAGEKSFVLADRLAYCRFEFLEPANRLSEPPRWRPDWLRTGWTPLGVRIQMAPLDSRPAEAQIANITLPMRIDRDPNAMYDDSVF
jgi:hypothetical protein